MLHFPLVLAATPPPPGAGGIMQLAPLLIIIGVFYFVMIRPTAKRQREHSDFLGRIKAGDQVVTTSGIIGRVVSVAQNVVTLEVAANTKIRIVLRHIAGPHSTKKSD